MLEIPRHPHILATNYPLASVTMDQERIRRLRILPGYLPTIEAGGTYNDTESEAIPCNDPRYACTKFGGLKPFFNPDAQWPLCKCCGRPQTFVGQINLEDKQVPFPIRQMLAEDGGSGIFQLFWWWVTEWRVKYTDFPNCAN